MAHQIESMAFVGQTPWHGLGTALDDSDLYDWTVASRKAGLDWSVDLVPLVTADTQATAKDDTVAAAPVSFTTNAGSRQIKDVQASVALHLLDVQPERARPALTEIKQHSSEALGELRVALDVLRRGDAAPRTPAPRLADLPALVDSVRASGLDVCLHQQVDDVPALPPATEVAAYAPHWNPVELDCKYVTLDLSHTAVADSDALQMADDLGERLAHVHLTDGTRPGLPDEHLVPGRGTQPSAELLKRLHHMNYGGVVVVEISTRRALTQQERYYDLEDSLAFAREHLRAPSAVS